MCLAARAGRRRVSHRGRGAQAQSRRSDANPKPSACAERAGGPATALPASARAPAPQHGPPRPGACATSGGARRAAPSGPEEANPRDVHAHKGVVEGRKDARHAEHVLALARAGAQGGVLLNGGLLLGRLQQGRSVRRARKARSAARLSTPETHAPWLRSATWKGRFCRAERKRTKKPCGLVHRGFSNIRPILRAGVY